MRPPADGAAVTRVIEALGANSRGPGRVYITGGGSAVLIGWRGTTIDVDLKLDPEPEGVFEAIARVKDELGVNIELASPDQFLPPVPGWRERSQFIQRVAEVDFLHYDFVSQALSKIERGHDRDLSDVRAMLTRRLVTTDAIREAHAAIGPGLVRYPAVDAEALRSKVMAFCEELDAGD